MRIAIGESWSITRGKRTGSIGSYKSRRTREARHSFCPIRMTPFQKHASTKYRSTGYKSDQGRKSFYEYKPRENSARLNVNLRQKYSTPVTISRQIVRFHRRGGSL